MMTQRMRFQCLVLCGWGVAVAACSSPPEPGKCAAFTACGGALVGRWDAVSFCVDGDPEKPKNAETGTPECRNLYASVSFEHVVSTLDFSGTSGTAGSITYFSTTEVELTSECSLALYSTEVSPEICAMLTDDLKAKGWDESLECSGTSICYCSSQVEHIGATILVDAAAQTMMGATGESMGYCVTGDTLVIADYSQGIPVYVTYQRVG